MKRALRGETFKGDNAVDLIFQSSDGEDLQMSVKWCAVIDQEGCVVGSRFCTQPKRD